LLTGGGHNVPEADISRRFAVGLKNFHEIYKQVVDGWTLYDNSGNVPKVIEQGEQG
jgi:predicted ABC-type ATPase